MFCCRRIYLWQTYSSHWPFCASLIDQLSSLLLVTCSGRHTHNTEMAQVVTWSWIILFYNGFLPLIVVEGFLIVPLSSLLLHGYCDVEWLQFWTIIMPPTLLAAGSHLSEAKCQQKTMKWVAHWCSGPCNASVVVIVKIREN